MIVVDQFFVMNNTRKEDTDGDGIEEEIREYHNPDGSSSITIIDDDGTIYRTEYNEEGEIVDQFKTDPDGTSYWWDDEKEEWRVDQNQNGIPDDEEEQDNSTGNSAGNPSKDSGNNGNTRK